MRLIFTAVDPAPHADAPGMAVPKEEFKAREALASKSEKKAFERSERIYSEFYSAYHSAVRV